MESDSASEAEEVEEIPFSPQWPKDVQELLLQRGVNDYVIRDRMGKDILEDLKPQWSPEPEHFPLQVIIRQPEDASPVAEATVIRYEQVILKLRSLGAPGAGSLQSSEQLEHGLEDFAVAFGGGGVRSGAFCTGVLWALAETGRLRHVTHISSVSGGSIAASGFASFLVKAQRATEAQSQSEQGYREVVAEFIERSQRNAGYLVSFDNLFNVPEDNSSSCPRILDLPIMALVVLGVLVAAPSVFCVFYVVPVTLLVEAYWGGPLRDCWCKNFERKIPCYYFEVLQPHGTCSFYIILGLVAILMILALVYKCCGMETIRHSDNPRWYLHWRSLTHLCARWLVMLFMVLATVLLVYTAELVDWSEERQQKGPEQCYRYHNEAPGILCSDVMVPLKPSPPTKLFINITAAALDDDAMMEAGHSHGLPSFIVIFLFVTVVLALISATFKFLGWKGLWRAFLFILLPLWFIWPASFLLQWRIFGPVTRQALLTPFFDAELSGMYSDKAWYFFTNSSLALAIASLPAFNLLHRFVHYYFRWSLQRAFYHGGVDMSMVEVAQCPSVPVLLFGATLNEFMRPESKEAHSLFSLSQYAMGCQRTHFLPAPKWMSLARCMTLSCAAIDGFVLTQINKWHTRILMAMLNLTQGDWLRFDRGQKWPTKRWPVLLKEPHLASLFDRLPEMIIFAFIYLFCLLGNDKSRPGGLGPGSLNIECQPFRLFTMLAMASIVVFIGIFSFFGHVRWLNWLLDSPLIRQIHMFLMYHECMEKPPMYLYLTDGGPVEDLGIVQLLRRRRRWILSFDVGDDPTCELLDLRTAIALARKERLCSFYLHKDPRRDLEDVLEEFRESTEELLHLGVLYSNGFGGKDQIAEIFHVRMRLLSDTVPVQPLVHRDEVVHSERSINVQHGLSPVVEMQSMPDARSDSWSSSSSRKPRGELGGICCECCHDGRYECHLCGSFPDTHTVNQFFTPTVWANFCRLGREMAAPAIRALTTAQLHETRARAAAQQSLGAAKARSPWR